MDDQNDNRDEEFRRLLWFLLRGSRGGENRAKILNAIRSRPGNLNQLAKLIGVDYRSVQHHMVVLQKNNLVLSAGQGYGVVYSIHPWLAYHFKIFEEVCQQLDIGITAPRSRGSDVIEKEHPSVGRRESMPQTGLADGGLRL